MKRSKTPPAFASRTRSAAAERLTVMDRLRDAMPALLAMLAATAASVLMLIWVFPPSPVPVVAFVALVPWAVAICAIDRAWIVHWISFLGGWAFFLVALRWLMPVTGLGYVALAFYLAIYFPMVGWAVRTGRRVGISPVWTLPVAWVATELLRGSVMSGFPWLFLAHGLYQFTTLIQISDLGGAYAVSFVVTMVSGLIVDLVLRWRDVGEHRRHAVQTICGVAATVAVLAGTMLYGKMRLDEAKFAKGPRIAVIQEDFPLVSVPPYGEHPYTIMARYLALAEQAARSQPTPDLIVFPETVWSLTQNISFVERERQAVDEMSADAWARGKRAHDVTSAFARGDYAAVNRGIALLERGLSKFWRERLPDGKLPRLSEQPAPAIPLVLGSVSVEVFPENAYPTQKRFNSALLYDADGSQRRQRYDKTHLVPFGEQVPFRNKQVLGISLHWLYRLLNSLSPFSDNGRIEYSLWPGDGYTVFSLRADDRAWRFGIPICYEDVMPYVIRGFVWDGLQRRVDFLINISNDGWFLHSNELPQHLAIAVFRAVENRVGFARAVNTGVSGFIDPSGEIHSLVATQGCWHGPGVVGFSIDQVSIDDRGSFYGRFGDLFAIMCLLLSAGLWLGGIVTRWVLAILQRIRSWQSKGEISVGPADPSPPS